MALDDDVRRLAALPAFHGFDPNALRLIAFSAEMRILRAGDVLFRKGDTSDGAFVVVTGAVASDPTEGGGAGHVARPGALIGETALVSETKRPASAVAREPTTVLKVSRALFRRVLTEFPDCAARYARGLGERTTEFTRALQAVRPGFLDE